MQKILSQKKTMYGIGALTCISVVLLISFSVIFYPKSHAQEITSPLEYNVLGVNNPSENLPIPEDVSTLGILLLGYGGAGHDGGYLTDVVQVLFIDFKTPKMALISIPRDLFVKLPNGKEAKINAGLTSLASGEKSALIQSGGKELKKTISSILGISISYFIGVDFVGFQRIVGINLDGLEVEVAETLEDPWYPVKGKELESCDKTPEEIHELSQKYVGFELEKQFPCRYKHLLFKKGLVKMEGGDALEYVRSRHGSSEGDVSRGKRQQEILRAMRKKLFSLEGITSAGNLFTELAKNTTTDLNWEIVSYILPALKQTQAYDIRSINLSTSNVLSAGKSASGAFIMLPKSGVHQWTEVQAFIQNEMK